MIKDYYDVLELQRNCSSDQICEAFKKQSLKWHPERQKGNKREIYQKFCDICEAFEVLENQELRSIYDTKGLQCLKQGYYEGDQLIGCYEFMGNPEEIFNKFFGSNNFYEALIQFENEYTNYLSEKNQFKRNPPQNIEHTIDIILEDLYFGKNLTISLTRQKINQDGFSISDESFRKEIIIPQGYDISKKLIFPLEGNQLPGFPSSDLIIELKEQLHQKFIRKDLDLFYKHKLTLNQALQANPFQIKSIDNRDILIPITEIINPNTVIKIENEGMRRQIGLQKINGDLYIQFEIEFPKFISLEDKQTIDQIL